MTAGLVNDALPLFLSWAAAGVAGLATTADAAVFGDFESFGTSSSSYKGTNR